MKDFFCDFIFAHEKEIRDIQNKYDVIYDLIHICCIHHKIYKY